MASDTFIFKRKNGREQLMQQFDFAFDNESSGDIFEQRQRNVQGGGDILTKITLCEMR